LTQAEKTASLLLLLQAVATIFLWTLESVSAVSEGKLALFLAVDLLSFAIVAYVYTHEKWSEAIKRSWVLLGSIGLAVLLIASLCFP
jgi:ABC-type transport system involved in cytochrome c biogenesis permease subunit